MKLPKFKPTKWSIEFCMDCKQPVAFTHGCRRSGHNIVPKPNVPFFVQDMRIIGIVYKGWAQLRSDKLNQRFLLSPSNLEKIIMGVGVQPKGHLRDNWWMFCKVGGLLSLKVLEPEEDEEDT